MEKFVAIDFETATSNSNSACSVGMVTVWGETIVEEYYQLIQPPENHYLYQNIRVHGIKPEHTRHSPTFEDLQHEFIMRLQNITIVAHNASFDLSVLQKTMSYYGIDFKKTNISSNWACTLQIYRNKGFKPANLKACCEKMNIELDHHNALSDAKGSAYLYMNR